MGHIVVPLGSLEFSEGLKHEIPHHLLTQIVSLKSINGLSEAARQITDSQLGQFCVRLELHILGMRRTRIDLFAYAL